MKSYQLLFFLVSTFSFSCQSPSIPTPAKADAPLISYVDPFIGTGGHGHTYPGATLPFGMMQLSPDTRLDGWDGCSGYHYSDEYIYGFSHTHLSGTGVSDYGDVLLMPTNKAVLHNGADGKEGYRAHFSHDNETAEPGYYQVYLDDTEIDVALTVSKRSGIHQYSYPSKENQFLVIDLEHRDQLNAYDLTVVNDSTVQGYRHSKAWATDQRLFFYIEFSKPFQPSNKVYIRPPTKETFQFVNPNNEKVYARIGISAVDIAGAKNNLYTELGAKTFKEIKKEAQSNWERQLSKIIMESEDTTVNTNFYTALYHTMIAPNLYQDVDGRYRGMDLEVHKTTDFEYYTVFSLWDTYRAAHPLYTILEPDRTNDFINTFLAKYDEGGIMPIWDLSANYTGCMIGYHGVSVIADAYLKGIRGYDVEKALTAMKHSATRDKLGLESYKSFGFIPVELESESVSKTLEYAYDDWTIAMMAKDMGKLEDYSTYAQRAQYYKNSFDPSSKFMRGRFRNTWFAPFDPYEVNFNYTEANAWQYSFYVPQDISGFTKLLGGKAALEQQLDTLFVAKNETSGRDQADITGLIGQYAHGNEPSHHMAYLYNFVNTPYKTQEKVRQILTELYTNTPDGISGNEDCGQMSAWYVFSALGFYPVTPGSNQYIIGSPLVSKASIQLNEGKQFTIATEGLSEQSKYIEAVFLNGKPYPYTYIKHEDIVRGGSMVFVMSDSPTSWGTDDAHIPSTQISDHLITPVPYIASGEVAFKGSTIVSLACADPTVEIFYSLGGEFVPYKTPISISQKTTLSVYGVVNGVQSATVSTDFFKIDPSITVTLGTAYANQYNGGGPNALIDGVLGTQDFRTGTWQGYFDTDLNAIVDLGKEKLIHNVKVSFLKDQRSWIFLPTAVEIYTSLDGVKYTKQTNWKFKAPENKEEVTIETVAVSKLGKARYIKVIAKKLGALPSWHLGYEHKGRSWLFVDEIQIK